MSARTPPALEGRLVLLVEDESLIVFDVKLALERSGARVVGAPNATRALELIERHRPDAAILDLKLGRGENSEPVADRLGELDIPFVVHTGDALRHSALLGRLGARTLQKPYPSHELARIVAELLADRPLVTR